MNYYEYSIDQRYAIPLHPIGEREFEERYRGQYFSRKVAWDLAAEWIKQKRVVDRQGVPHIVLAVRVGRDSWRLVLGRNHADTLSKRERESAWEFQRAVAQRSH